jgi:hypothetical protein
MSGKGSSPRARRGRTSNFLKIIGFMMSSEEQVAKVVDSGRIRFDADQENR